MKKFTMLMAVAFVGLAANAATVYFENTGGWSQVNMYSWTDGAGNNGGWPGVQLTETAEKDGKTYFKGETDFKMVIFNGGGTQTGDLNVVDGGIYNKDGFTNTTWDGVEIPDVITYAIHGQITGDSSWASTNLDEGEDGVWSLTSNFVIGNFGVKQMTNGAQSKWYGYEYLGEPQDNCEASSEGGNIYLNKDGKYTISFDPETTKITVKYIGEAVNDYSKWTVFVVGDFNDWSGTGIKPLEGTSIVKHEKVKIGTETFKVNVNNGTNVIWYSTGGAIPMNEWVKIDGNNDKNMTIEGAAADQIFDVEWDCATTSIKVTPTTPTGVAAVEAANGEAVYFNMQGVRVANPENGLFIRVQNGKAVKVVK